MKKVAQVLSTDLRDIYFQILNIWQDTNYNFHLYNSKNNNNDNDNDNGNDNNNESNNNNNNNNNNKNWAELQDYYYYNCLYNF